MNNEADILAFINKSILTENGISVTIDSMFLDAEMDSLGTLIALMNIGCEYDIDDELLETYDVTTLSVKDLVEICK